MSANVYVYAVLADDHTYGSGLEGVGDPPAPVRRRAVDSAPVHAAVSDAPDRLVGKRRDLLAHHAVVDSLAAQGPTLPMRFGVVAASADELSAQLTARAASLSARLQQLAGTVEVSVKARLDEDELVRDVLRTEPGIRRLRDAERRHGGHADRLRLGEAVAGAVAQRQHVWADRVHRSLSAHALRSGRVNVGADGQIATSYLVPRDELSGFRERIDATVAAATWPAELTVTAPLPPYSFVDG